ncbi:MAG: hypothetical protein L6Q51_03770 [Cyclobacteriaceae bacterium]|nr:hypothetical protein [Cyclobacteriaceae bacterium]
MKREEELAFEYFSNRGYGTVRYEPKGNRPPDLLIDESIAVEVRRLNQFDKGKPIEDLQYKLVPKLIETFKNYGDKKHTSSAWIDISYSRPIKVDKDLVNKVISILDIHSADMSSSKKYKVGDTLELSIFRSTDRLENQFNYGSSLDDGHGGFVVHNIYESLKIIVEEKSKKIDPYRQEYGTWWLALVDYIGYGLNEYDLKQLKDTIALNYILTK